MGHWLVGLNNPMKFWHGCNWKVKDFVSEFGTVGFCKACVHLFLLVAHGNQTIFQLVMVDTCSYRIPLLSKPEDHSVIFKPPQL